MLWIFVILGSLTLMSVLYGLIVAGGGRRMLPLHVAALLLVIVAMLLTHATTLGLMCLVAALALESWAWFVLGFTETSRPESNDKAADTPMLTAEDDSPIRVDPVESAREEDASEGGPAEIIEETEEIEEAVPASDASPEALSQPDSVSAVCEGNDQTVVYDEEPIPSAAIPDEVPQPSCEPETPEPIAESEPSGTDCDDEPDARGLPGEEPPPGAALSFTTNVLFRSRYVPASGVFLASLRRCGQRDAALSDRSPPEGPTIVEAGPIVLELRTVAGPCDSSETESAVMADSDWSGTAAAVSAHEGHAVLTSTFGALVARDRVIRLHHRAHAALAEFAPVAAVMWPQAERLESADRLAERLQQAEDPDRPMAATYLQFRSLPLEGETAGLFLTDSVGLHAFGLPDLQIITVGPPNESEASELRRLAERFLKSGCDLVDGSEFAMADDRPRSVVHGRSAFAPDREIVQIAARRPETE